MPLCPTDDTNVQYSNDCCQRNAAGACPRNCQKLLKGKQLLLSKQFFEQEEQLPAQTLDPMQNPVVTKRLEVWKMLFFARLFTQKAPGRLYSSLQVLKGGLQERQGGTHYQGE